MSDDNKNGTPLVEDLQLRIDSAEAKFEELRGFFDLAEKKKKLDDLTGQLSEPEVWKDQSRYTSLQQKNKYLTREVAFLELLYTKKEDIDVLLELSEEGENIGRDLESILKEFEKALDTAELQTLYSDRDDIRNAILTIHPGAGGTESQDWAQILLRMYLRYGERMGYKVEVLDLQQGEEAGIKNVTLRIEGEYAYGNLSRESGVHRLVRISPFDANSRRHTSFAAVFTFPEIDDDIEVAVCPDDLKIDTYRASGAGGQHFNVTDSAVRITHIPTGIVVQCQNERSQHKNKAAAMKVLKARLYELEKKKQNEKLEKLEDAKSEIAWGNQIRSYVLHPYKMIKDTRTKVEVGDVDRVLDGDLEEFIKAALLLRSRSAKDKFGS
ncbi:MAG: peptide chain release factor 2 [Candidatus Aminicenantes bacterium]|nr:peptide chain release factor 2 [Candidatus Aminicenantes bacterium]